MRPKQRAQGTRRLISCTADSGRARVEAGSTMQGQEKRRNGDRDPERGDGAEEGITRPNVSDGSPE